MTVRWLGPMPAFLLHPTPVGARPALQLDSFEREVVEYVKPNHGTTTLGFIFQGGVIIAVDSRASQGSYICERPPGRCSTTRHRAGAVAGEALRL